MIDKLSVTAVPLRLTYNGLEIMKATGCFYRAGNEIFLVTNWHVFSCRKPIDFQPVEPGCPSPNEVHFPMYLENKSIFETHWVTALLIDDNGHRIWFEHCVHGPRVDVAVLNVTQIQTEVETAVGVIKTKFYCASDWIAQDLEFFIGEDFFIIGFPLDYHRTGHFPIWKRASIASEPQLPVDNLPMFLVDTATRPGMSGSPAIKSKFTLASTGKFSDKNRFYHHSINFLGVYSGRFIGEAQEAQLGKVWKEVLIQEIIAVPTIPEVDYAMLVEKWGIQKDLAPSWLPEF